MNKIVFIIVIMINNLFGIMINGLEWQDKVINKEKVMNYIEAQNFCVKNKGRLPTINELHELETKKDRLTNKASDYYLSQDRYRVSFFSGKIYKPERANYYFKYYVRCIIEKNDKKNAKSKVVKGYLKNDLTFDVATVVDIIDKDTFLQINLYTNKIEEPKEYENVVLKNIPKLYVPDDKRKIDIINNKTFISFTLNTNVKIKTIKYDNKQIQIVNNQDYLYKTKPIRQKNKYDLEVILQDGKNIIYSCNADECIQKRIIKKKIKVNLIKGYLDDAIAISFDDYDDVISKGTYVVVKNNIIVEPKKYSGGKCQYIPKLGFNKNQRDIKVIPIFDNKRNLLKFKITSKVSLGDILFDNILLKYFVTNNTTRSRKIRDFEKIYSLILKGDNFQEVYECQYYENNQFSCNKKQKDEMK